jgi:hypothetical protein
MWLDKFDWVYRDHDYACFTMTIHPDVSSKPHVLTMHERIFAHISRHFGVTGATFAEIACDFIERRPRKGNECVHRGAGIRSLARRPATLIVIAKGVDRARARPRSLPSTDWRRRHNP